MGKAITEIDSYAGPISGTTKLPVSDSDTLQAGTVSQVLTYIVANLGDAATKNTGTTAGTVAAGDHTHSTYAATGAIGSSGLTMATAKLLGRSTASTGAVEEITLGTNLSFTGTTLNAAGGGGTPGGSDTQVQFNDGGSAFGGDSGLTFNKTTKALGVGGATVTTSNPVIYATQTWNAGAVTFTGFFLNITSTASAAASKLVDLQVGGSTQFSIRKDGLASFPTWEPIVGLTGYGLAYGSGISGNGVASSGSNKSWLLASTSAFGIELSSGAMLAWQTNATISNAGSRDTGLARNAAGVVEINSGTAGTYRDLKARNLIGTGNLSTGAVAKTADYTATTSDGTIEVDASGVARTITLFAASGNAGKILVIKKTDSSANAVTIDGNASETIDGATTISLASQYSTAILQVNAAGTGWNKLAGV